MISQIYEKKIKKKIIKKWEKELTPSDYSNFDEFDQYQKNNATFNKCYVSQQDVSIFFHCRECCQMINGLYCVYCFNRSNHTDHHVSVMYLDDAFCDCGDPKFIKKESWCSLHIHPDENANFIDKDFRNLLNDKIHEIFEYAIKKIAKESFCDALKFLLNITEWGSVYNDLISKVLFEGSWENSYYGQIFIHYSVLSKTVNTATQKNPKVEQFRRLLLKLVVSPIFKRGFITFITDTIKIISLVYSDPEFPKSFLDIADFAYQCLVDGELIIQLQKTYSFFTELVNFLSEVYSQFPFLYQGKFVIPITYNWDFHYLSSSILSSVIGNPLTCKFITKQPDCLKAIAKFLMINSSNVILKRQTEEKEQLTEIHLWQLNNYMAIRSVYEYFALNFPMITVDFDKDIRYNEAFNYPIQLLNDEHILILNQFFTIFIEELDKLLDFDEKPNFLDSSSYYIQPYTDDFFLDHPLAKIIISCATCFSIYNSTNLLSIFDRVGFKKFDQLAALFACCEASKCQISNQLFLKNNDSLLIFANRIDHFNFFILPAFQSLISIKYQINSDSVGDIVTIIAESFGFSIWEKVIDPTDCQRWTNVMTLMLRLFINLSCNDNFFNFLLDHEKVRNMIIDYIYCGETKRMKIIDRIREFTYDIDFIEEEFEKVVDVRFDHQGSHFKLKPEYDDTSSVFSPYLFFGEFNKMISYEIKNHKGRLFRFKRFDPPESLVGMKSYLQTEELKTVIHRILQTALSFKDKFSISCSHTLFSLIRLILIESENPEETEENYISSNIINLLIQLVKKLENGILYLQNFIEECKPRYNKIAGIIEEEIREDISKTKKNKPKIDRSKFLAQFTKLQNDFANQNEEELKTIENSSPASFTCVYCEEPFNSDKPYGILADIFKSTLLNKIEAAIAHDTIDRYPTLCQIRTCGHWSHQNCFEESSSEESSFIIQYFINDIGKQCPLDRAYANAIIPAFKGDAPDEKWKEAFQKLSDQIIHVCDSSAQQCLAYNIALIEVLTRTNPKYIDDKRNVLGLIHLLRACFFMEPTIPIIEPADPFVCFTYKFCSGGDLKGAQKKFNSMLPEFWHELMMPIRIVEEEDRNLMIETYIRRVSLLEQLAFNSDSDSFQFPTVSEFIEMHNLNDPIEEMKTVQLDLEKVSFLSPCLPYTFPNLRETFTDYFIDSKIIQENQHSNITLCQCLLCGKMCFIKTNIAMPLGVIPPVESLDDHCMRCTGNLCQPFLFLTDECATAVFIFDGDLPRLKSESIYTDKYGDENEGLKGGNMLFLNKYRMTRLFEDLVTGETRRKLENGIH